MMTHGFTEAPAGRRRIAIVSTGGTIEMDAGPDGIGMTNAHNALPLDGKVIPSQIDFRHFRYCSLPSPQISLGMMADIVRFIEKLVKGGEFDGVVVTHGTDTLEETAFLADIYLTGDRPVVFTASMRSLSERGVDGPRNLRSALLIAADPEVHKLGVTVVLNDEVHAAGRVTKTYTSNVSSFGSPGYGPLGFVDQDRVLLQRAPLWRVQLPRSARLTLDERVGLVRVAADFGEREVRHCMDDGCRGLVIEALGRGNVPPAVADAAEDAVNSGMIVCVASRCYIGRVLPVYDYTGGGVDLQKRGLLFAGDMQGHKLRLFLMACIGMGLLKEQIRDLLKVL
jgi:L-asparaginase